MDFVIFKTTLGMSLKLLCVRWGRYSLQLFSPTFLMSDIVVLTVNLGDLESVPETRAVMITMGG